MLLTETGYKPTDDQRFRIFLTNSLEEASESNVNLFSQWLSDEANQANAIKRDAPVMVVMGNPPYSGESANKGEWIMNLMEDYKKEPGGKEKLKERNPKMVNDDYVKFIRFGQYFIDKNGSGILAFINPHGFLDNPTFRGMRWNLLKSFDKIFTIDLHGNTRRNETSLDGSVDQNVFDIMQGVSINLFVKTGKKKVDNLAEVFHYDLYGKRELKYDFLNDNQISSIPFDLLKLSSPMYIMKVKDVLIEELYQKGFIINDLFSFLSSGVTTSNDSLLCDFTFDDLKTKLYENNIYDTIDDDYKNISYKPFDIRAFCLNPKYSMRSRKELLKNFKQKNYSINLRKTAENSDNWQHIFITNFAIEGNFLSARSYSTPLYLYPESTSQINLLDEIVRTPNLNMEIVNKMANALGIPFVAEKSTSTVLSVTEFAPIDILDYIYAVLHSPSYRSTYKEFLKIDFPRVPYPKNQRQFIDLVDLGSQLRQIHLLESEVVDKLITQYPEDGTNVVVKPRFIISSAFVIPTKEESHPTNSNEESPTKCDASLRQHDKTGRVFINETQYFANVPEVAWNFYIGGYQPAQKWLKDRKDRELSYEDIRHYQKIIVALNETDRLMKEIDKIEL